MQVVTALRKNLPVATSATKRKVDLAAGASEVLSFLFDRVTNAPTTSENTKISALAVLSLMADLFDGYLAAELGQPLSRDVRKRWRKVRRRALEVIPKQPRHHIASKSRGLKAEFLSSLKNNLGAQAIADELSAITLAIIIQYPDRSDASSGFTASENALYGLIRTITQRI